MRLTLNNSIHPYRPSLLCATTKPAKDVGRVTHSLTSQTGRQARLRKARSQRPLNSIIRTLALFTTSTSTMAGFSPIPGSWR
ncbi:hypothetical protein BD779DRAFT_1507675 [Infundibulicybe gibba]|nr:hypothetical protein BD779DRAFT_1507675 [Infundibulicybe gibba]